MSFLDFLQKKQKKEAIKKEKKETEKKFTAKEEKAAEIFQKAAGKTGNAFRIVKKPRITEKAGIAGEQNKYIFEVYKNANKPEVKKAVEEIYGKNVEKVRIINIPPKKRRRGRIEYYKSGLKKAVVTLKEGETIEVMPR